MSPTLEPGDRLLVVRGRRYRVGDVVALADPRDSTRTLVKRVSGDIDGGRAYQVVGDRSGASTDSRAFGPVPGRALHGRVVYRYFPPNRTGVVRRPRSRLGWPRRRA